MAYEYVKSYYGVKSERAKQIAREAEAQLVQHEGWRKASPDELRIAEYAVKLALEAACKRVCDSCRMGIPVAPEPDPTLHILGGKLLGCRAAAIRAMMNTTK